MQIIKKQTTDIASDPSQHNTLRPIRGGHFSDAGKEILHPPNEAPATVEEKAPGVSAPLMPELPDSLKQYMKAPRYDFF